jgi:DNA excision repair protein ERCC-2
VKIDLEAKTLEVSVRELVAPRERAPIGPSTQWRARLGARAHSVYESEVTQSAADEERVETEVPLVVRTSAHGFEAKVRGRADVVRHTPSEVIVEEVKSVLGRPGDDKLHRAMFQARLYALALEDAVPVRASVVLYSLIDGTTEILDARYDSAEATAELHEALGVVIDDAVAGAELAARRRAVADTLVFPFPEARAHQLELLGILEEALDEGRPALAVAPTGIGKTITTLLPALRHALRNDATVFYLTAKTTQRQLVGETFERIVSTAARGEEPAYPLRALTLRSRAQMCPPGDLRCHPALCPLLSDFEERCEQTRIVDGLLEAPHLHPDTVFERGAAAKLCPYELSMRAAEHADVIIGDYNHLFDPRGAPAGLEPIRDRVVVLDEAHNLFDRARGYYSPFVGRRLVRAAAEHTRRVDPPALGNQLASWCEAVLEVAIEGARFRGEGERQSVGGCSPAILDVEGWENLAEEGELLGARYAQERFLRANVHKDDPIFDLVAEVSQLAELAASRDDELVAYASDEDGEQGTGVGIVCVDPSRRLERVHRRSLGTLVVSATMAPIRYFSQVLGFSRLDPVLTSAPSPFPSEQRCVRISADVSTTYREREAHAPAIARHIAETYRARPGRYIAFFPSFAFAGTVRQYLDVPPREVLVQLPASGHAARTMILRQLQQKDRALLLAVMGGVFGEGIDLPGEQLIGAMVIGPGLPPVSFERLAMQHHFNERHENGFAYAMVYPGLQRVIQAAGRVIRTMEDVGAVVLVGRRFAEPEYLDCLPEHWYRHRPEELITDDLAGDLASFWESV